MKTCCKCKRELQLEDFCKNKKRKDGHGSFCKECNKAYHKKHYKLNKEEYLSANRVRINENKAFIKNYKAERGCCRCPEKHPICLQFHHIDRNSKEMAISTAVGEGRSMKLVMLEIEKCIILCANCHFKEHDTAN